MYTVGKGVAPESDVAVISIMGYDPFEYSTGRGILEAIKSFIPVYRKYAILAINKY